MKPTLILRSAALVFTLAGASVAHAQSDREVAEISIERSAAVCPGHSAERTAPTVRAVPVGALRVLLERGFVLCPDRRLDADAPAVWYGQAGVYAWNPEVKDAGKLIIAQVDAMTRKQEFPTETVVWDASGKPLQNRTVPAFEARPGVTRHIIVR